MCVRETTKNTSTWLLGYMYMRCTVCTCRERERGGEREREREREREAYLCNNKAITISLTQTIHVSLTREIPAPHGAY